MVLAALEVVEAEDVAAAGGAEQEAAHRGVGGGDQHGVGRHGGAEAAEAVEAGGLDLVGAHGPAEDAGEDVGVGEGAVEEDRDRAGGRGRDRRRGGERPGRHRAARRSRSASAR